jgi:cobalamin biosynthesis Mg chelatase CobN
MIPLTLRAMLRTPHPQGPSLGRPAVALVSVLALLAFACLPALAQAETVYENESTTLPGGGVDKTPTQHKNPDSPESSPKAHDSTPDGGGTEQPDEESSVGGGASKGNPSTPGGVGDTQGKDGEGANVANKQPGGSVQDVKPLATTTAANDDSSSPLVPILIAVAVLAAISVGAVLYRQRRGDGSRFSPNAS